MEREGPFGEGVVAEDLAPGGGELPVTAASRGRFVELYVRHLLEASIEPQFAAFRRGFDQARARAGRRALVQPALLSVQGSGPPEDLQDSSALLSCSRVRSSALSSCAVQRGGGQSLWACAHPLCLQDAGQMRALPAVPGVFACLGPARGARITPHAGTRCFQSNAGAPRALTQACAAVAQLCAGPAMALFRPEELEQLVCGRSELDFSALQRAAAYENGYSPDSPARSQIGLGLL